jgi:hypothetical protein
VIHDVVSTPVAADGLVVAPDIQGYIHCLDATTGRRYWVHDAQTSIYSSRLIVEGRVYVPDHDGMVKVLALRGLPRFLRCWTCLVRVTTILVAVQLAERSRQRRSLQPGQQTPGWLRAGRNGADPGRHAAPGEAVSAGDRRGEPMLRRPEWPRLSAAGLFF